MARSLLGSFVSGTRAVLSLQLFVSIGAVALAGWTLAVTNDVIRDRDRLRERVIQLEETMASRGIVVPSTPAVVATPPEATAYPDPIGPIDEVPEGRIIDADTPPDEGRESEPPAEDSTRPSRDAAAAPAARDRDLGAVLGQLFNPAQPLRTVVLHIRAREDAVAARQIARAIASDNVRVIIDVMQTRDGRQSGYTYYDGRQSGAAAEVVTRLHEAARELQIAPWSAQLRGVALPAQGEYTGDRLDIVLPPLPAPAPQVQRLDPRVLEQPQVFTPRE